MNNTYVLDTSVLIHDPTTYKQFPDSKIIIPIAVLNELDNVKKQPNEAGKNARVCIRLLDEISNQGDINTGVALENNITLQIDATHYEMSEHVFANFGDPTYGDTQILACAYMLGYKQDIILISNDINLRIKAKSRGIQAISHEKDGKLHNELYTGYQVITNETAGLEMQQNGFIDPEKYGLSLHPNECVLFQNDDGDGIAAGRLVANNQLRMIRKIYPWGVAGRNKEQSFAIDLIMDRDIDLVTLVGSAGTGKSLIALATGLELVLGKKEYERLVIYRPIQSMGNDIGYTPGTIDEKLAPHFSAIMDSFEFLFGGKVGTDWKRDVEMYQKKGRIELGALTYIRGRSVPNSIMLIDEAQNIPADQMKTILTRAGEGTKVILTGDIDQIDRHDLDATNNGLTRVIEKFKSSELAGHITFAKGERSRLATYAAKVL